MQTIKNKILPLLPLLFTLLMLTFGANKAWGVWSGSGSGTKVGNTYYVLYATDGYELSKGQTHEHTLLGPGATLTFDAKRKNAGTGNLLVTQDNGTSKLYEGNPGRVTGYSWGIEQVDYQNYGSYSVDVNTQKITFKNNASINTNSQKQVKNVYVTMAQYLENPSTTSLDCGTADINTSATSNNVTVAWCNVPAMSYQITDDAQSLFSVAVTNNSAAGKYNTATFTVTYKHTKAGTHTAKLKITDTYNSYSKTITLTGTTNKLTPTITWSPDESIFIEDDVLRATNANGLEVTLSVPAGDEAYVRCEDNTATMLGSKVGTITVSAAVTGSAIYKDTTYTKEITITNLTKQYITWNQDFSRLKTTDASKSIVLNATASSGLAVSYELSGDKTGLSLTQSGNTWTLTYSAVECKNTTIVAKQGGDGITYAPASSVSLPVKVIDPTTVCDTDETLVNSTITMINQSASYNIDIPSTMTIQVSRTKTGLFDWYFNGFKVEFYAGRNGTGSKLHEFSYGAGDINNSKTISLTDLNIAAKSVKLISEASNGYDVTSVTYTHQKYCTTDSTSLNFKTYPNTTTSEKTFTVNYANYPIILECANNKFTFSPSEFGDCSEYGTQIVSVTYTAGADEGEDIGYLYIKDNTGATLKTCTLNVSINKVSQSITSTTIQSSYNTTDRIELSPTANSGLTNFAYSATPEGVASFEGNVMTFSQSGTIDITVTQPGSDVYASTSTTVNGVQVNKVTPDIATEPNVTTIKYLDNLVNGEGSQLSGGMATVTLRGVENTSVEGTFTWKTPKQITDAAGTHEYPVVFTPTKGGMYTNKEWDLSVTISRADASIEMKNSEVLVTVDDLYQVDLDTLIVSQTEDPIAANRAGNVSYSVFSDNKAQATIDVNNLFSATQCGTYTIVATKAQTNYYVEATDTFTIEVGKLTPVITGNNTAMMVDAEQENAFSFHDVNGQVAHITITSIADVHNGDKVIEYDAENNKIIARNAGVATIYFTQAETSTLKEATSETYTYTIHKYNNVSAGVKDSSILVDENITFAYTFTYTKPNDAYIGTNHPADVPTLGESSGNFFYTLTQNISTDITAGSDAPESAVAFEPDMKKATGKNQGVGIIAFKQKETYKYNEAKDTIYVSVSKRANELTNSWGGWETTLENNSSQSITFTTTNTNYAQSPITVNQTYGAESATMSNQSGTTYRINTTAVNGYATWFIRQAEDYKYHAAEADVMVMMGVPAPPKCYIVEDYTTHSFSTDINDWEGHFDSPIAINAPVDKLWFTATRQWGGFNYFVAQYSVDNGSTWRTICNPSLDYNDKNFGPYSFTGLADNEKVTHIRFGALQGATLTKWYKNIKVSRKAYLDIENALHNTISTLEMPSTTISNSSSAKFYIDYSTCDDEIYIESNNPLFTLNKTTIAADGDNFDQPKEEITVTYSNSVQSKDTAIISVYTNYQRRVLRVTAETNRRTQTLEWQDGYTTNPITLPVGWTLTAPKVAATASSGNTVTYSSSDETIVRIIGGGSGFEVVGEGSATITAHAEGNETWEPVSEERDVVATIKIIQEIGWEQTFPRFMEIGEKISLDAKVFLLNLSTGEKTYSADRTAELKYTSANSSIVSVANNVMTVNGYGSTTIRAEVSEHEDYEKAVPVNMLIVVRQPSTGCETPLVFEFPQVDTLFLLDYDFSNWQTPELISPEFEINPANGVPDKLSFQHSGAEFIAPIIHTHHYTGYIKVQQRVGATWTDVPESRVAPTMNEWNELNNLQLDENANRIRFIREANGTGYHFFKDVRITLRQYMRVDKPAINFGDVKVGETRNESIELDYSDLKGDVSATRTAEDDWLTLANSGAMNIECGSHGQYSLPITFVPKQKGEWKDTIVVFDNIANIELRIPLQANVLASDLFIFEVAGEWGIDSNWNKNSVPALNADVSIGADVTITSEVIINSLVIQEGKKVTIMPNGGLTVGAGGIIGANKTNLILKADTVPTSETKGQTGYLRISPAYEGEMPEATVELFSKAYYDPNSTDKNNTASWQYVGIPVETEELAKTFFANSRIYSWNESSGEWINDRKTLVMKPFIGYCTSQYRDENGMLVVFKGKLVNRRDQEVLELSYTPTSAEPGLNVFANSYSAPIDITKIDSKDFNIGDDDDATIHLFNTGSRIDINNQEGVELNSESVDAAGQYISIPVGSANDMKKLFNCPTVIAPMQGFFVNTTKDGGTLTLRYEDVVWKPSPANTPMRSRRNADSEEDELVSSGAMKVTMSSNGWKDRVYLLESEQYSTSFEKGIDARKLESGDFNIFVVTDGKRLAVDATNSINNTYIGVRTGEEMYYTMVFTNLYGDTEWSLLDTETNEMTNIEEGSEYSFYAEPNTEIESRFIIIERAQVPSTPTDIDGAEDGVKVQKFIKENQMYILKNGILYNAQGKVVR